MSWIPPHLPLRSRESKVGYWQAILEIPDAEPSAPILRSMAAHRLVGLGALSEWEARPFLKSQEGTEGRLVTTEEGNSH